MALVLAMHNRGFTEIGTSGMKAQGLAGVAEDEFVTDLLTELVADIEDLGIRAQERIDAR